MLQASTIIGIIVLAALILNIIYGAFRYVATQNSIEPNDLVMEVQKELMLAAPNTVSSEDDNELADRIASSPNAIGYFGYAYYQDRADELRSLDIDGVAPTADTVDSNEYRLARPLFLYSDAEVMEEKPQVAAFLNFYLDRREPGNRRCGLLSLG